MGVGLPTQSRIILYSASMRYLLTNCNFILKHAETMRDFAIGIDLGTTYTVASIYRDGQTEIIPNKEGDRLTPSTVFYDPNDPTVVSVGKVATDCALKCPKNFMFDMKRIIGRNYYDAYVQNFISMEKSKSFPLQIINSLNDVPSIKLETKDIILNSTVTPEEVSSEILKYIKDSAKVYLGCDISEAVISIPAHFSYAQREATKRAAEKVGFNVLKLITEPVAAAVYYTFGKAKNDSNLLMFDLGGGTLDVSIIKYSKDKFRVKSIEGDMFLGGRDFDEILFKYLRIEIGKRFGSSFIDPSTKKGLRFLTRLRTYANKYKHVLSTRQEYSMPIDYDNDDEYDILITRGIFETLSEQLFRRIMYKVKQCLFAVNLTESDIDKVVLVGGSTRIPKLKELLSDMFKGIELCTDLHPDEAVALGAGIHAALLKGHIKTIESYRLKEVAPFSLGVLAKYDLMVMFIEKGKTLPVYIKQVMETSENDQKSVIFKIYEGERKNCKHNKKLGDFLISNLPPGRAGHIEFEVIFSLDENGLLSVSAEEKLTGKANQLEIKMKNLALCDNGMFVSLEYEQRLLEEDELYDEFYRLRLVADTYCNSILYDVDRPILRPKKDMIVKEVDTFLKIVDNFKFLNIVALKSELEILKQRVGSLWNN